MPTRIFANNEPMPQRRDEYSAAVLAGMNKRPGEYQASILVDAASAAIQLRIEGIEGTQGSWSRKFEGPGEKRPEFIQRAVEQARFIVTNIIKSTA